MPVAQYRRVGGQIEQRQRFEIMFAKFMRNEPRLCRPGAYYYFAHQLAALETTERLLRAVIGISMHALDDVRPWQIDSELQQYADRVRERVQSRLAQARLAHLHQVLFDELEFRGNHDDYHNPLNSYLSTVLATRLGIPVSLSLIYKVVAERVGLRVEGLNLPGHFMVRVWTEEGWTIVDPYHAGRVLTAAEACEVSRQLTGREVPDDPEYFARCSHAQWVSRILHNLQYVFQQQDRQVDYGAMTELQTLLDPGIASA